jgi:hypothetical protein
MFLSLNTKKSPEVHDHGALIEIINVLFLKHRYARKHLAFHVFEQGATAG